MKKLETVFFIILTYYLAILHVLCKKGDIDFIKPMINTDLKLDLQNNNKETPLVILIR